MRASKTGEMRAIRKVERKGLGWEKRWVYLRASKTEEVWAIRMGERKGQGWEQRWVYLRASKTGEVWAIRKVARKGLRWEQGRAMRWGRTWEWHSWKTTEKKKAIHSETRLVMMLAQGRRSTRTSRRKRGRPAGGRSCGLQSGR